MIGFTIIAALSYNKTIRQKTVPISLYCMEEKSNEDICPSG